MTDDGFGQDDPDDVLFDNCSQSAGEIEVKESQRVRVELA
jgi:hypothetical protein